MITTVIGAKGFIGRSVVSKLKSLGLETFEPDRDDPALYNNPLGHVIYCAGVTSDFRQRPFETIRAHVSFLAELLEKASFDSFLYLSSTRVYVNQMANVIGEEDGMLLVNSSQSEDLFSLSKLTGESLCLNVNKPNVRVVRVSNVCGPDFESNNFIYSIIKDALNMGGIVLQTTLDSEKDYISVSDVANLLIKIAHNGKQRIYNVASGFNITNQEWVDRISDYTGCKIEVELNAKVVKFPTINTSTLRHEFNFNPPNCLDMVEELIQEYANRKK